MKELLRQTLTGLPEKPYYKGGAIFMAMEGKQDMSPQNSQRTNPERSEQIPQSQKSGMEKPVSAEQQVQARKLWEEATKGRVVSVDERRTIDELVKRGIYPVSGGAQESNEQSEQPRRISQEEAIGRLERAAIQGRQQRNVEEAGQGGTPPQEPAEAGGAGQQPPGDRPPAPPISPEDGAIPNGEAYRINLVGITEPALLNEASVLQTLINTIPPAQRSEKLVDGLERIALLSGVNLEQKDRLIQVAQGAISDTMRLIQQERRGARTEGLYGERKLLDEEKEQIRSARTPEVIEELFNRMFDRVDSRPQVDFNSAFGNAGTFEYEEFMKTIIEEISAQNREGNFARSQELSSIRDRFSNERSAREIIHNSFFAVIAGQNTEAVANYIASFLSGYADMAFSKAGVVSAMHFYEEALLMVREKNGGFLRPKDVIGHIKENNRGEVNILTEQLLREANENLELAVDGEGRGRQLTKWELDRALSFARGMSIITGNSIEIAASSIIPGVELGGSAFNDLFAQRIIGEIYPFRHTAKFWAGSKFSKPLAYLLNRNKAPWTPKELEEFHKWSSTGNMTEQIKVLNDLMPEGQERFYSVLNPFEIGGLFSRTGWRIGGDPRNPGETAIKNMIMNPQERDWIGTGVIIERERGNLEKLEKDPKDVGGLASRVKIQEALERTANVTPLKLFLNIRELKERVLTDLFEGDYFRDEEKTSIQEVINKERDKRGLSETEDKDRDALKAIKLGAIMNSDKFKEDFNSLVLLQERALSKKNEQMVGPQSNLARIIRDTFLNDRGDGQGDTYMDAFLQRLQNKGWKVPFIFGTEDIPFDRYTIEDTGPRSLARRWADMQSAAKAGAAFNEFLIGIDHYTKPEQIVEAMHKIYLGIFGYNEEFARKFTRQMAEGVMRFYGKSWTHRLPLGIGTLHTLATGNSSFAQIAYGRDAMSWDELDLNAFTRLLRERGLLTVEEQHELQERAGGGKLAASLDVARTVLPLLMIAMVYYMITEAAKERRP